METEVRIGERRHRTTGTGRDRSPCYHPPVRQAEPAAVARRLFEGIAGDEPRLPRRILATTVVSAIVIVSVPLLIASVLGLLSGIGVVLNGIFPVAPRRGAVTVSWILVFVITVAFLALAVAVSWTSQRRGETRSEEPGGRAESEEAREMRAGGTATGEEDAPAREHRADHAPGT